MQVLSSSTYGVLRRGVTIVITARVGIIHWTAVSKVKVLLVSISVILASSVWIHPQMAWFRGAKGGVRA